MDTEIIAAVGTLVFTIGTAAAALRFSHAPYAISCHPLPASQSIPGRLKRTARLIEQFYALQELPVRVKTGTIGYQVNRLICEVPARLSTSKVKKTVHDLEHFLLKNGVRLNPGSLTLVVSGNMIISYTKKAAGLLYLSRIYRKEEPTHGHFPIGLDMGDSVFSIPLDRESYPHGMIVGSTGGGKTLCAMCIIIGALHIGWKVIIFNPKPMPPEHRPGLWD